MKIAYFLNAYPGTSMTFIRTEINAIEEEIGPLKRYAIRRWDGPLVSEADQREQELTRYIFDLRLQLLGMVAWEFVRNPRGFFRALGALVHLYRNARSRPFAHLAYFVEAVALKSMARADKIEHLHTHFLTNSAAVTMLSRLLGGPSYSVTAHGPNEFYEVDRTSIPLKVKHAEFIACISQYCEAKVHEICGDVAQGKTRIVRCGIDLNLFRPNDLEGPEAPLVCVGRLCPEKAQTVLVEAVSRLVKDYPGLKLYLVGDGECRDVIEKTISSKDLGQNISLLGWRSHHEVSEILAGARALVLPSFAEGLPMVIMEAMALGRPVVTTPVAGIPELVTSETGWLVDPGDVGSLSEALRAALDASDTEMSERANVGIERVTEMHNGKRNALQLLAAIRANVER